MLSIRIMVDQLPSPRARAITHAENSRIGGPSYPAGATWGSAEEVIVKERPAVTIALPGVGVEVEKRDRVERREVETTGRGGCDSKTVRKEGPEGTKTVEKERCD
jgi:hypothetical protein